MTETPVHDRDTVSAKTHQPLPRVRSNLDVTRLGEMLRLYRAVHDLTVRDVAKQIGVHYSTLSRFERTDTGMTAEHLLRLMQWMLSASDASEPK